MQRCDAQFDRIAGGLRISCCIIEQSRFPAAVAARTAGAAAPA
jgi:hypothetical protein